MKKYLRTSISTADNHIEVVVEIDLNDVNSDKLAASTYKGFYVPEGELLPSEKNALIGSQALEDYHAFIESVEDLLTQYYELDVYYKNESPDHSIYFGLLAKNSDGTIIVDIDFVLRVSNHQAHRSAESQHNKKIRQVKLNEITQGRRTQPVRRSIVVNKDKCSDYMDAYVKVDEQVKEVVERMIRKKR